jgi:opacity protein-like surface antigen
MPKSTLILSACLLACASAVLAQSGEIGFVGGVSFYANPTLKGQSAEVKAGFANGFGGGVVVGHNTSNHLGGEIRYLYQQHDLEASSGSTKVTKSGRSQAVHYDLLIYATGKKSRVRPFLAVGGGVKQYSGTGAESATQPLSSVVILTTTNQWKPLITLGGGVKVAVSKHVGIRLEVRDYLTPFPNDVITPVPPVTHDGWLHDIVPTVGLNFLF